MHKNEVLIYWSREDKIFIAEVPKLAGCLAHGKTQTEALQNVNQAIQLWIETAKEFGDRIPQPKRSRIAA
ncbi:MAG: type II toxin-antitoxin system HicB family antitoxin [Acidobacteria bacterium]|nr:type II toxin-antitoxin system HicB family antitoxin [Acidobacteriota bacterium]